MNILIVDDDKDFVNKLEKDLLIHLGNIDENISIDSFTDNFRHMPLNRDYRILFIDIELFDVDGIQLAKKINAILHNTLIIFVSSHNHLVQPTLIVHPFFFINKSHYDSDMDILYSLLQEEFDKKNFIKFSYKNNKGVITINNIVYIESINHMLKIVTTKDTYFDNRRLKDMLEILPNNTFVQIHKSYIINLDFMTSRSSTSVTLYKNTELNIGRKYRNNFNHAYEDFLIR